MRRASFGLGRFSQRFGNFFPVLRELFESKLVP